MRGGTKGETQNCTKAVAVLGGHLVSGVRLRGSSAAVGVWQGLAGALSLLPEPRAATPAAVPARKRGFPGARPLPTSDCGSRPDLFSSQTIDALRSRCSRSPCSDASSRPVFGPPAPHGAGKADVLPEACTHAHSGFSLPVFTAFLNAELSFLNQIAFPIFKSCMWG